MAEIDWGKDVTTTTVESEDQAWRELRFLYGSIVRGKP